MSSTFGKGGGRSSLSGQHFYGQGYGWMNNAEGATNGLFTPTYLRGSKYIERLEAAYKAKLVAQRAPQSGHSVAPGSLSNSSSSVSLYKMAPSHRGMTYEIIEHQPPIDDDGVTPLPSKWNEAHKNGGLEISADGLDVKFVGPAKLSDHEGAAARADHPMPPQCGIYFFEVTIVSKGKEEYGFLRLHDVADCR
jgi:Ran-binding protein 9/10